MSDLTLVKSESFGTVQCDFYQEGEELYLTREQIGTALEYAEPAISIGTLHKAHNERLDQFSLIETINGRQIYLYSRRGVMEICRWSRQPKADSFMDWCWDIMEALMRGEAVIVPRNGNNAKLIRAMEKTLAELLRRQEATELANKTLQRDVQQLQGIVQRLNDNVDQCVTAVENLPAVEATAALERRISSLEAVSAVTSGTEIENAEEATAQFFVSCIQKALDSEEFILYPKGKHLSYWRMIDHTVLGHYDDEYVTLDSGWAYNIYSHQVEIPISVTTLWKILQRTGKMRLRETHADRISTINGVKSTIIRLYRKRIILDIPEISGLF